MKEWLAPDHCWPHTSNGWIEEVGGQWRRGQLVNWISVKMFKSGINEEENEKRFKCEFIHSFRSNGWAPSCMRERWRRGEMAHSSFIQVHDDDGDDVLSMRWGSPFNTGKYISIHAIKIRSLWPLFYKFNIVASPHICAQWPQQSPNIAWSPSSTKWTRRWDDRVYFDSQSSALHGWEGSVLGSLQSLDSNQSSMSSIHGTHERTKWLDLIMF